jgi:hypothetical protein
MSRRMMLVLMLMATAVAKPSFAQQTENTVQLNRLSTEQQAQSLRMQLMAIVAGFTGYVRATDSNVERVGEHIGARFATTWRSGLTPAQMVSGIHRNFQLLGPLEMEVIEQSAAAVTARRNRPYAEGFDARFGPIGTTLDEFEQLFYVIHRAIAGHHDLTYSERREGDWIVFTVSRQ